MIGRGTPNIHNKIPRPITKFPHKVVKCSTAPKDWSAFNIASMAISCDALSARADIGILCNAKFVMDVGCRNGTFRGGVPPANTGTESRNIVARGWPASIISSGNAPANLIVAGHRGYPSRPGMTTFKHHAGWRNRPK
jgi:hypothetical protein